MQMIKIDKYLQHCKSIQFYKNRENERKNKDKKKGARCRIDSNKLQYT